MGDRACGPADLGTRPAGTRLICRRERPHPGAQLSLFDIGTGFRHTCFLASPAGAKACGLRNFPFEDFVRNEAWLALVLMAQDPLDAASVRMRAALC